MIIARRYPHLIVPETREFGQQLAREELLFEGRLTRRRLGPHHRQAMAIGSCNLDLTRYQLDESSVELKFRIILGNREGHPIQHQLEKIEGQGIVTGLGHLRHGR